MKASAKKTQAPVALVKRQTPDISALLNASAKVDPLTWVMLYRRLHGAAMTFDMNRHMDSPAWRELTLKQQMRTLVRHRPFLMQPLCDQSENKVYEKGRQVGISELSLTEVLQFLDTHDGTKWVYTFPREKQLIDFATTRIKPAFEETPRMKSIIGHPDQVMTKRISKSFLLLRSAWEANLGEGIDADGVTFDEKDRMKEGIEIAFKESLSSSKYGFMREVSTPSLPGRGVDASYQKSCQYEWFVPCLKCGEKQSIDYPDNIVQMKEIPVGATELEEGTYEYRCKRTDCRGPLDRLQGQWVAKYPSRKHISGYWMPQTIAVWISATKVMQKRIDYKYPQLWTNYVLGRTSVGDSVMLTPADFEQCSAGYVMYSSRPMKGFNRIAVGIDWGHQNWVVVMGLADNGLKYVLAIMMFEDDDKNPLMSVKMAEEFIRPFNPDIIVADAGYGKDRNSYLLRKYPESFFACYYNPSDARSRTFQPQWSEDGHRVLCDRTMTLKDICRSIKEREVGFPDYGERMVRLLERHFLNLAVLKIEEDGEIFEVVEATGDDHLAHASAYAELGLMKEEGGGSCDLSF